MSKPLRLGEFVATLALAQDNAFGQPLESQLRSCLLGTWICEAAGFDKEVRDRRDRTYDPALADAFVEHGAEWFERLAAMEPWDAVLDLEPKPWQMLDGAALDNALTVAADFIDLKSPYMAGHSRRCAQLSADAAKLLGCSEETVTTLRRAALVHDFGTTGASNSILDKRGPLTRAEFDRVELHPMLTEQMLRRSAALAVLNPVASAHHERCDGSGYHKRLRVDVADQGACVLAVTEIYVGLTTERADRGAFTAEDAAAVVRKLAQQGALELRATQAVLATAGHGAVEAPGRAQSIRAGFPLAKWMCCVWRRGG